jgi:molybdate transport system permease protein
MSAQAWEAVSLTLRLATATTLLLLILATPLAWWLSQTKSAWRSFITALVTLPLVLPPTVLGFYLLTLLSPERGFGKISQALGFGNLAFSFTGLLIGSIIFSLPFAVQPLQHAFQAIGKRPLEAAASLGAGPIDTFFSVVCFQARAGFVTAAILSFAHTVGEFGVVLMIGGNIPGQTQVISTQIYAHVEALEFSEAHWLSALVLVFSFVVLVALSFLNRHRARDTVNLP